MVDRLDRQPLVARRIELIPVRWEHDAYGGRFGDFKETIKDTIEFERLDIVVVVVWNRLGERTLDEHQTAENLWQNHQRPQRMVYVHKPLDDADLDELEKIRSFKEPIIEDGVVPNICVKPRRFAERPERQITRRLPEPRDVEGSRGITPGRFSATASLGIILSVATLLTTQTMASPEGVNHVKVIWVLLVPVFLFTTLVFSLHLFHRLLAALKQAWHSRSTATPTCIVGSMPSYHRCC